MWKAIRYNVMFTCLVVGFLLMMAVAVMDVPDKRYLFDLGYRIMRVGATFGLFPDVVV